MRVLPLPTTLDADSLEEVLEAAVEVGEGKVLVDGRHLRWVDPPGMVGLLALGAWLREHTGHSARLQLSEGSEVVGYLGRMGFHRQAQDVFELGGPGSRSRSGESDVLLEVTPIQENDHIHAMVDRVQSRAGHLLSRSLGYPATAVVQFSVILSEVCQNILEHADAPGWVAAQVYHWGRRLGRNVLVIGVGDLGRGFRGSLEEEHAARFGDRWGDGTALEAAFIHGFTRFPDSGRGQGLQQIRKQVRRWGGSISIRSGTARIADVAEWEDSEPLVEGLVPFPGSQVRIVLPARLAHGE